MKQTIPTIIALTALFIAIAMFVRQDHLVERNQALATVEDATSTSLRETHSPSLAQDSLQQEAVRTQLARIESRLGNMERAVSEVESGLRALSRAGITMANDDYRSELERTLHDSALSPSVRLDAFKMLARNGAQSNDSVLAMMDIIQYASGQDAQDAVQYLQGLCSAAARTNHPDCP